MVAVTSEESLEVTVFVMDALSSSTSSKTLVRSMVESSASSFTVRSGKVFATTGGSFTAVMVTLTAPRAGVSEAFAAAILRHEEVLQCHVVTGDFDFLLMVQARSIEDYHAFAQATFGALPTVRAYKTTFVLRTHKNVDRLPDWALSPAD